MRIRVTIMPTVVGLLLPALTLADEAAILADLTAYFRTEDPAERQRVVNKITADPEYDRARVHDWLHRADLWAARPAGRAEVQVPLRTGESRRIVLRIPRDYDPRRPWPVIYCLHGAGGAPDAILGYFERILGPRANEFVLAAPDDYGDLRVDAREPWPPAAEHPAALRAIRRAVHVDSDRVYLAGYSMGGHTSWTVAVLHAQEFAGALPLAGTFTVSLGEELWERLLGNLSNLPVLAVWGSEDNKDSTGQYSERDGITGRNRRLKPALERLNLPVQTFELAGVGHGDLVPPANELTKLLDTRRMSHPVAVHHTFRDTYQGRAYWLEAHRWAGEQWDGRQRTVVLPPGQPTTEENVAAELAKLRRGQLGELEGRIDGQELRVRRKKIKELTVWVGDGMIDWERPVVLDTGDGKEKELRLTPDLGVCLAEAARTWDFDRLRWAGIRIKSGAAPAVVTADTEFPDLLATSDAGEEKTKGDKPEKPEKRGAQPKGRGRGR